MMCGESIGTELKKPVDVTIPEATNFINCTFIVLLSVLICVVGRVPLQAEITDIPGTVFNCVVTCFVKETNQPLKPMRANFGVYIIDNYPIGKLCNGQV